MLKTINYLLVLGAFLPFCVFADEWADEAEVQETEVQQEDEAETYIGELRFSALLSEGEVASALSAAVAGTLFLTPAERDFSMPYGEVGRVFQGVKFLGSFSRTRVSVEDGLISGTDNENTTSDSALSFFGGEYAFKATGIILGAGVHQRTIADVDYDASGHQWVVGAFFDDSMRLDYTHFASSAEYSQNNSVRYSTNRISLRDFYGKEAGDGWAWELSHDEVDTEYSPQFFITDRQKLSLDLEKYWNLQASTGFKFILDTTMIDYLYDVQLYGDIGIKKEYRRSYQLYSQYFLSPAAALRFSFRFAEKSFEIEPNYGFGASFLLRF